MTTTIQAIPANAEETAANKDSHVPLAIQNTQTLATGTESYGDILAGLSNSLEVFQNIFVTIVTDEGQNNARSRMFFATALIPGTAEKIPVFGLRESRMKDRSGTYIKLDVFVFNGQERVSAAYAHINLGTDGLPKDLQVFMVKGHNLALSANFSRRNGVQIYDHKGQLLQTISERRKKKKGKMVYEAKESNQSNRHVCNIEIDTEKAGYNKKRMKEMRLSFLDPSDVLVKPQVFMAAYLLLYMNKLY